MNFKRKGPKSTRAGCLMCKPHKDQKMKDTKSARDIKTIMSDLGLEEWKHEIIKEEDYTLLILRRESRRRSK